MGHTTTPATQILSTARYYAHAAARYQHSRTTSRPRHLARIRFLEVTAELDRVLTHHILCTTTTTQTITTATDAALIKAAARDLADHLTETHTTVGHTPEAADDQLLHRIHEALAHRDAHETTPTTHQPQALAA